MSAQPDQVPQPALVPDERVVKVVLTAHPEEKAVNTDADSTTRRRVPDQTTDLDSPVSDVVPVLQLRKSRNIRDSRDVTKHGRLAAGVAGEILILWMPSSIRKDYIAVFHQPAFWLDDLYRSSHCPLRRCWPATRLLHY